ncbi:MAG: hypothetical protein JRG91_19535 [Deltaproteobacteria bacterium]|nr:hypothetical protein [Deltaproteobacteria bacterium]
MSLLRTVIRTLALTVLAITLSTCSMAGRSSDVPEEHCYSDVDCPDGQVCHPDGNVCVPDITKHLVVKVSPFDHDEGSGYLPDQYFDRSGKLHEMDTDFQITTSVVARGTVFLSPASEDGVEARIEFRPVATTFPETLRKTVSTSTTEEAGGGTDSYEVSLLPGTYDVLVYPSSPDSDLLPPLYPERIAVDTDGSTLHHFAYPTDLTTLTGTLHLANDDPVPHGLRIWAVDATTGRRVSTTSVTGTNLSDTCIDDCAGSFTLVLSPTAVDIEIRVTPDDTADAAGYPFVSFGSYSVPELDLDEDWLINMDYDYPVPLRLPLLGDLVVYKAKVEGLSTSGVSDPLQEVAVKFTAERDGALFETYAVTNAAGEICIENSDGDLVWSVLLRENDYEVTITPPAGGEFESLIVPLVRVSYSGDGTQMGQVFELKNKPPFVGRVFLADSGAPLEGLTAEAYPVRSVSTGDEGQPLPRFGTDQTSTDGMLRLDLDRGVYDILMRGSANDGVAWLWKQGVEPGNEAPIDFDMESPIVVSGTVLDEEGEPEADALIRVYEYVLPVIPGEEPDPDSMRLVWEATTSVAGSFQMFLSPEE